MAKDSKITNIRLTEEERFKLETEAFRLDRSMAWVIRRAVEQYFKGPRLADPKHHRD